MARSDDTLRRVHRAYEGAHVLAAARALAIAGGLFVLALGVHGSTNVMWLVAITLAATLGVLAWRGGAWRRGALAGVLAGLHAADRAEHRARAVIRRALRELRDRSAVAVHGRVFRIGLARRDPRRLSRDERSLAGPVRARRDRVRGADRAARLRHHRARWRARCRDRPRRGRGHRLGRRRAHRACVTRLRASTL